MRVSVGLPSTIPGCQGRVLLEWARRADAGPFSALAVLDRIVYDSYDPLIALAAVAGATTRIRLATNIIIAPIRNTTLLARSAASLQTISGGRLSLGVAIGARQEDYEATGAPFANRSRRFTEQLSELQSTWEDKRVGPSSAEFGPPRLLLGGSSDAVFGRVARYADGYMHGGGPPRAFARAADKARAAWLDLGRPGMPILWGQGYFALGGDDIIEEGHRYVRDYYSFTGPFAEKIAEGLLTTPQAIAQFLRGYADAGCDEVALFPTSAGLDQLTRLIDAVSGLASVESAAHAAEVGHPCT